MRTIPDGLKFLHCMCHLDYLESALNEGLMFTDHEVKFAPAEDPKELSNLIHRVVPLIERRFGSLDRLSEERLRTIFSGIGNLKAKVPMLCFTEVPLGKNIKNHGVVFGSYGLVLKSDWMVRNNADRVIYVGHNSPASQQLFLCLATMRAFGLFIDENDKLLFDNEVIRAALNLLPFFEVRDHLIEAEWRIAGNTGFMGGHSVTGTKIPLLLSDIDYVFVPNSIDAARIENVIELIANKQNSITKPIVVNFPECIP